MVALPASLALAAALVARFDAPTLAGGAPEAVRIFQPVQEYHAPFGPGVPAPDRETYLTQFTHLGTDFGPIGPAGPEVRGEPPGYATLSTADGRWGGLWHSLAGLAREHEATLDFARCYPPAIRDEYQPVVRGVTVRAKGVGSMKVEIQGHDRRNLWERRIDLSTPNHDRDWSWELPPGEFRRAKFMNWVLEPGSEAAVDAVGLIVEFPALAFPERVFLASYAKLLRSALPGVGLVKDHAHRPAGAFETVPATGLLALATAAAAERGLVPVEFARQTLREGAQAVARLPKAHGWLPHFVSRDKAGNYRIHPRTEFSTVDTAITYHGLILAARVLHDYGVERELLAAVRLLDFERLRGPEGYLRMGIGTDGKTPLASTWNEWGGEAALVVLLERLAKGDEAKPVMSKTGRVPDGVGFVGEIQSLFYPQFDRETPDRMTHVNWAAARRDLVREQAAALAAEPRFEAASKIGMVGLSAGEGFRGRTYAANGPRTGRPSDVLHPHYMVMATKSLGAPDEVTYRLRAMEAKGILTPWGMVENVTPDLAEVLPMNGSLNAGFESLGAYHFAARAAGNRSNAVYEAAKSGPPALAMEAFYGAE